MTGTGKRRLGLALGLPALIVAGLAFAGWAADRALPLDLSRLATTSTVVEDRHGAVLRAFMTPDHQWRLPVEVAEVSPIYLDLLIDIEDKRFRHHPGFDPLALVRAAGQWLGRGRIVSGGSTLTMQVVRLLEPRPRTLRSKLIELGRAMQLEAHFSKSEILRAYLTLTPMGGNLQGVRAGSLAWFGKEPAGLSDAEAALLVALPQRPYRHRPDAFPDRSLKARDKILRRGLSDGVLPPEAVEAGLEARLPDRRIAFPILSPHLAERHAPERPSGGVLKTTLDAGWQRSIERILRQAQDTLPRPVTVAAVVADWHSGEILARVGSGSYFDARRAGMVDMTRAIRSPGSTLKPFIYGMGFDALLAHPASLVRDEASRFDDYAPHNFDGGFNGDVTVRQALQWSLNLPAVLMLQKLGPVTFTERFRAAGLPFTFENPAAPPGLPVALGGVGTTLESLVTAYAALADGGTVKPLIEEPDSGPGTPVSPLLEKDGADAVVDILAGMRPPEGFSDRGGRIAYKTGTSYRFRDGWAIGFDQSRVVGVWMGRADGGSCPGCVGIAAAAILYRLFDGLPPDPLQPRALSPVFAEAPPPALARLKPAMAASEPDGPRIAFPPTDARMLVDADIAGGPSPTPVKLVADGGTKPYRWLVDGKPIDSRPFARETLWHPGAEGFSTVTLVDADGRSAEEMLRIVHRTRDGVDAAVPN